jgi:hypothetical protein
VKAFYEDKPFPNYDDLDSRESLVKKAGASLFAATLRSFGLFQALIPNPKNSDSLGIPESAEV